MKGAIQGGNLADVFREIVVGRQSGLLFLKSGAAEKGIYFAAGRIRNAESNVGEEGIGYRLLEEGRLLPHDLESAMRQVEPGRTLHDVLIACGAVTQAEVDALLPRLAEQVVLGAFDWTHGSYFFQEGDFSFKPDLGLNTPYLLLEGVRRMFDFDTVRDRLLRDHRPLRPLPAAATEAAALKLDPAEGYILSRVDGSAAVADICALSLISEEMTCRVLLGFLTAGIIAHGPELRHDAEPAPAARPAPAVRPQVRPVPPSPRPSPSPSPPPSPPSSPRVEPFRPASPPRPAAARPEATPWTPPKAPAAPRDRAGEIEALYDTIQQLNHYAILGLGHDVTAATIEDAWQRLSERFHPGRNAWLADDAALRSKAVFVFAKVKSAYETLRDERKRRDYDETLRRHEKDGAADAQIRMEFAKTDRQKALEERMRESEGLFREASKLFDIQRYHPAHEKILKAIQVGPEDARFYALAGRIAGLNPNMRWQKDAENHLRKAIELDVWKPEYRVWLGLLYRNAGMAAKAKREFFHALELDPSNETALAEVPPAERPVKKVTPTAPPPAGDESDVDWS